ncbi:MAG: GcrA cell cycle regulator [Neomegalonema sp.]|nr:GcrA cell cycle regulator [Neomegalonema sp.]
MSWTNERVEKLKELWAEGKTASQIAKELGNVSRNAVIGKVHRLGLSNRNGTGKPAEQTAEAPQPEPVEEPVIAQPEEPAAPTKAAEAEPEVMEEEIEAEQEEGYNPVAALAAEVERRARKLSLLELTERTCKWPIGDPATDDFYFCGLPCETGKPYCEAHVAVAFQPMSTRRERERERNRLRIAQGKISA